jgi:hypothetical protein
MTNNYHTPIPASPKQPAIAATFNTPMAQLDAELTAQDGRLDALEALEIPYSGEPTEFLNGDGDFAVPSGTGDVNGHVIQSEGVDQPQRVNLNFSGEGVSVVDGVGGTEIVITGEPTGKVLTENRTYYIRADGSDTSDGLTNNSGGAFLTHQHAVDIVSGLDIGNYNVEIIVADGTYNTTGGITLKSPRGFGSVTIVGNETTPANVMVTTSTAAIANFLYDQPGVVYHLRGMKLTSSGGSGSNAIRARYGAVIKFQNIEFGGGSAEQSIRADNCGIIEVTGNYRISGSAAYHILANTGGEIRCVSRTITITGALTFTDFIALSLLACALINGNTYTLSGGASVAGQRYLSETNAVIYTGGGGANYFPGNSAGSAITGLYV